MLNKNIFKMVSLFTFVMLFLFNVSVSFECLASPQNEKTPNGYTPVNDFHSSSDEESSNLAGENSQINDANGENNNGEKTVTEEEDWENQTTNNQDSNLTENNSQSDDANEENNNEEEDLDAFFAGVEDVTGNV